MHRILIIEDDADIALSIKYSLEREGGFVVCVAEDGEAGLAEANRCHPDLVLLDLNLPAMDGIEVCRRLRGGEVTSTLPIIMVTARAEERDTIRGLDLGADDYITKPFSLRELIARVRAVLRRGARLADQPEELSQGPLLVDEARRQVSVDGNEVRLTRKEFDLLADLMRRPGLVRTREKLLARVWEYDHPGATRTVDVHVRQLRKKLGPVVGAYIETVVGVGYRFPRQAVMTVRRRLLLIMSVAGLLGAVVVAVGAIALLRTAVRERAVERIQAEASLLAHWVENFNTTDDPQSFAQRVARRLGARVSLIAPDGVVIGDSSRDRPGVSAMVNHFDRPEVRDARLRGSGSSFRLSTTTNVQYFYAAHRVPGSGRVGYVRLALPASAVQQVQTRYSRLVVAVVLVAIVLLVFLGYLAVRRLSGPLERIAEAVELSAAGDFHAPLPIPREGGEEVSRLATSVRRLQLALLEKIDELDDERALLASVIAGMREGLLLVDGDRRVRLANQALSRVLDLSFDPRGHLIEEVVRHPSVVNDIDAALREGHEIQESVISLPGSDRVFELHVARLDTPRRFGGVEVLALFVDITRLDRLEKVRREFVANVSHELRTPLTSIKAFVENLVDGGLDDSENALRFMQIVSRHADHMGELIEDLTDLSLIETGAIALELRRVDACEVAHEVADQLKPLAAKRDVDVRIVLPSPFPVISDRRRLEQMLTNLVSNAINFNREGGRVVVDGLASPDVTTIAVEDTGIGIPAASHGKVFERFYQVSRDRSRAVGGTGLGLSIVKHLMALHGGRVQLVSELGHGSKLTLEFPTTDDERRVIPLATSAR